jgi:WD40 repeat protein
MLQDHRFIGTLIPLICYIYSYSNILKRLCGHQGRSFNTAWSPLINGLLASGSDDKTINIWQIELKTSKKQIEDLKPIRTLTGHTSNVRALCWNLEHKNILLSGSWDSTICIWDALKGSLISVVKDHVADVYSICSHVTRLSTYTNHYDDYNHNF